MINIEFLIVCLIISEFIDWIFQWNWEATNKSKWGKHDDKINSLMALLFHSFIYSTITTIIVVCLLDLHSQGFLIWIILLLSHIIIDNRVTVNWIMRFKGVPEELIGTSSMGFLQLGIDQILHHVIILIIAIFI